MQITLEGGPDIISQSCCKACYFAKGDKCQCRCGGVYHGIGQGKETGSPEDDEVVFSKTLRKVLKDKKCRWCQTPLNNQPIRAFPHSGGWTVGDKTLWLYVVCQKCRYQWALWKLGFPRDATVLDADAKDLFEPIDFKTEKET